MSATRRGFGTALAALGVSGSVVLGGVALGGTANAEPPPGCTTADMTGIMSGASAALSAYLFSHPDVNAFFTGLQGLPKTQVRDQTEAYLVANPDVRAALQAIRQPSVDFRARCNLPQRALTLADNL